MKVDLTGTIPTPHAKQRAFLESAAKRKVIVAGRRGGKTTACALDAVDDFFAGRRVLESAPTQDQTEQFWDKCKAYLSPLIDEGYIYKNESRRLLRWFDEGKPGRIRCKTAWDADTLRGDYADKLILDEYSLMSPSAWLQVGAPMLLDNGGDAVFTYTPKRRNHGYALFVKARADATGRYGAWHFTSMDNPHLDADALAEITADMTDEDYRQEILAQFLENEGAVFHKIGNCLYTAGPNVHEGHEGHTFVAGVDWGKKQDYTVMSIGCVDCRREVELLRFNQIGYTIQRDRIATAAADWGISYILVELNAMGEANFDQMVEDGLPVAGWTMTAQSKPGLISNLALAIERPDVHFVDHPVATAELESFEVKYSPLTGRPTYSAPEGCHDDIVIARALMARCVIDRESCLL